MYLHPPLGIKMHHIFVKDDEDYPCIAMVRADLYRDCMNMFVELNRSAGELTGNTKSAIKGKSRGLHAGLCGPFTRLMWYQQLMDSVSNASCVDPIFSSSTTDDKYAVQELIDGGRCVVDAHRIVDEMLKYIELAAAKCDNHVHQLRAYMNLNGVCDNYILISSSDKNPNQHCVQYNGHSCIINTDRLLKLLALYKKHTDKHATLLDDVFARRLYCVIMRYETISSYNDGYQMAFPNRGFELLRSMVGVTAECFASPLNVTLDQYCSVAYDTDRFFGSCGSFWKFDGESGSYEANPPFTEEIMERMAKHILHILTTHEEPFSFAVIIPAWMDDNCNAFQIMTHTDMARPSRGDFIKLDKFKHNYCPGMQHRQPFQEQTSKSATLIFFLQNEAGSRKWPVTYELFSQFKKSLLQSGKTV